jgi:molybdate transport system ATP-binding protein
MIKITNGITRHPDWRMAEPINIEILQGEQIAIAGDNAAGKSRLIEVLTGHFPLLMNEVKYDFSPSPLRMVSENLKYITFRDSYGDTDGTYYYQQRWNQHDIDENTPTVGQLLREAFRQADESIGRGLTEQERQTAQQQRTGLRNKLTEIFHLDSLMDKYIISLSSGELRKFQLTKTLGTGPRVLIMDNPFIGLDAQTRDQLRTLLNQLTQETYLTIILVLSKVDEIPDFITHVIPIEGLSILPKVTRQTYQQQLLQQACPSLSEEKRDKILQLPQKDLKKEDFYPQDGEEILKFNNVSIRYGSRTILKELDWTVNEGEKWALSGENGAGKSTLLSLVCADNPQAYACDIRLFGHRRGSGESIWQIKRHIGYVSPEMHRAYLKDLPAIDIVASGLTDSVGLYTRPKPEQKQICLNWMSIFGIEHLADRTFLKLSSGEQRLCLLARAFVKDPELLILDEPLHGLDLRNRTLVKDIIDTFCSRQHKTLVMVTHYQEEFPRCITNSLFLRKN